MCDVFRPVGWSAEEFGPELHVRASGRTEAVAEMTKNATSGTEAARSGYWGTIMQPSFTDVLVEGPSSGSVNLSRSKDGSLLDEQYQTTANESDSNSSFCPSSHSKAFAGSSNLPSSSCEKFKAREKIVAWILWLFSSLNLHARRQLFLLKYLLSSFCQCSKTILHFNVSRTVLNHSGVFAMLRLLPSVWVILMISEQ